MAERQVDSLESEFLDRIKEDILATRERAGKLAQLKARKLEITRLLAFTHLLPSVVSDASSNPFDFGWETASLTIQTKVLIMESGQLSYGIEREELPEVSQLHRQGRAYLFTGVTAATVHVVSEGVNLSLHNQAIQTPIPGLIDPPAIDYLDWLRKGKNNQARVGQEISGSPIGAFTVPEIGGSVILNTSDRAFELSGLVDPDTLEPRVSIELVE